MTAELQGARKNAETVRTIAPPRSQQQMLADAILLVIQHIEKYYEAEAQ